MRSSIRDVAKMAGVSPMTVSNVLRRREGRVTEETRQRVLEALERLNYIPIQPAMQNRHSETHVIGVVFLQDMQGFIGHRTLEGMSKRAKELDYDLLIALRSQPNWMAPDTEARFLDRRCDGYVIVGSFRPDLSALLVSHKVPVVECYSVAPPPGVARVVGDDEGAMGQAVELLSKLGHTRIAHLGGPNTDGEAGLRAEGFRKAMVRHGNVQCADWIIRSPVWAFEDRGSGHSPAAQPFVRAVLALQPTAVVCANDLLAIDLWHAAEAQGLRVPEDLSITGMDNSMEAAMMGLTTLSVPFETVGACSVESLVHLMTGGKAMEQGTMVSAEVILRQSVTAPGGEHAPPIPN